MTLRRMRRRHGTLAPPAEDPDAVPEDAPWLHEATRLLAGNPAPSGLGTGRGRLKLVERIDNATPLAPAWCGLFVDHCLSRALPGHAPPFCFPRARPWRGWGRPSARRRGAIVVFWLVARRSPFGHVGFVWDESPGEIHVLGGNQRDRIGLDRFPADRLLACRWPAPGAPPAG